MLTSCFCTHNYTYKDTLRQHPPGDMGTVCKSTQRGKVLYEGGFKRYSSLTTNFPACQKVHCLPWDVLPCSTSGMSMSRPIGSLRMRALLAQPRDAVYVHTGR